MSTNHNRRPAQLYHQQSSNSRYIVPDLYTDDDNRPFRFRTYPGAKRFDLPGRDFKMDGSIGEVMKNRRSIREYKLKPLELEVVGRILHTTYGVCGYRKIDDQTVYSRSVPSAGGLYPLEFYIATQQVTGLPDGLYHYDARAHDLELRKTGIFHQTLADMTLGQQMICDANVVIIMTAIFERTMWKYGPRGYRYVWLDAGHACQNIYLSAGAHSLGPVAIGGFFDEELNRLLELPPKEEETIYMVCIGQPKKGGWF